MRVFFLYKSEVYLEDMSKEYWLFLESKGIIWKMAVLAFTVRGRVLVKRGGRVLLLEYVEWIEKFFLFH